MRYLFITVNPPVVSVSSNIPVDAVVYGSTVALECTTETLLDVEFHWETPNNQTILPVHSFDGVSMHTSILTVDTVKFDATGIYKCTATSAVGSGSDSALVNMMSKF